MKNSELPLTVRPLKSWRTGYVVDLNEPCLMVDMHDGSHMEIMMPAETAIEMGKALQAGGRIAMMPPGTKVN